MIVFLQRQAQAYRFHYAIQRIDAVSAALDSDGDRFASILSEAERNLFARPTVYKRKVEWLAGRLAAKRAFASYHAVLDWAAEARHISVLNDVARAPFFAECPELTLSLSHSHDYAVAVVAERAIGIDIEKIERRPTALARYFCCAEEQHFLEEEGLQGSQWDVHVTLLWCRKEAVAKCLRLGGKLAFAHINTLDDALSLPDLCPQTIRLSSAQGEGYAMALALVDTAPSSGERMP
jgi:4'-phosphopantetheinyl transferase EntD